MTDPLELFDQAIAERPSEAAPSRDEIERSLTACLEAASAGPTQGTPTPVLPFALLATLAAAMLLTWWTSRPGPEVESGADRPTEAVAQAGPRTEAPIWEVVHDDQDLVATLAAAPTAEGVVTVVVTERVRLDDYRIDDAQLDDWLRSIGVRPARIEVQGETRVLDLLASAETELGE